MERIVQVFDKITRCPCKGDASCWASIDAPAAPIAWSYEKPYPEVAAIAVRFAYEYRDDSGHWFRAYGNENWRFDADGLMERRIASINEHPIAEADSKFRWPLGRRPDEHPGLRELGF